MPSAPASSQSRIGSKSFVGVGVIPGNVEISKFVLDTLSYLVLPLARSTTGIVNVY